MKARQRAKLVEKLLNAMIPAPEVPFKVSSPFMLLIAVLLSAQCTDERVNKVIKNLFCLAQTPEDMAKLDEDTIYHVIRSCGLAKRKAQAILALSKKIVHVFGGEVPSARHALESLPGVGHKTASVVLVQAFQKPAFPVDTHIFRLARRWGLSEGKDVKEVEEDLQQLFPRKSWGKIHLQMILYARKYCPARAHKADCPICQALCECGTAGR